MEHLVWPSTVQSTCLAASRVSPDKPRPKRLYQLHSQDEETESQRGFTISSHPERPRGRPRAQVLPLVELPGAIGPPRGLRKWT